ncbi:helix-turn-helix domain-containing protein [bacterium]|nr:helix-turn-helix domain-containing protein [bacterium]MBR1943112.1 helix-turn-helix domain-containing protein [bacterium]
MSSDFFEVKVENINYAQNLRILRQKLNLTQQAFADSIGEKQTKIKDIETSKQKISVDFAKKVEKIHHVDFKWLLTGEGSMFQSDSPSDKNCITIERIHINPSCGKGTMVIDEAEITPITLGKKLIQNIFKINDIQNLKVFTASGDSMEPTIFDGDDLLVDVGNLDFNNGGIFVIEKFGDWFIKRLRLRFDGNLEIISDNKEKYPIEVIEYNGNITVNIKGKVIKNLSRGL